MKQVLTRLCGAVLLMGSLFSAVAAQPVLFFSDLSWGPKTGWEGSTTKGAAVTVWGVNFGSSQGAGFVSVNGSTLMAAASYAEWGVTGPARGLQRITFWLNSDCADGAGTITVTVNGVISNALPFTVAAGSIYFVSPSGSNSNNGLYSTAQGGSNGPFRDIYMFNPERNPSGDGQYIVYVRGGTYTTQDPAGDSTFVSLRGPYGSATKQKALVGYPAETPVLNCTSLTRGAVWPADYSPYGLDSYFTYAKLTFTNGNDAIDNFGNYVRVVGNHIQNMLQATWSGVVFSENSQNISILGNFFDHCGATSDGSYKHNVYSMSTSLSVNQASQYHDIGWNEFANAESGSDNRGGVFFARTDGTVASQFHTNHLYIHDNYFHGGNQNFIEVGDGPVQTDFWIYGNLFVGGPSVNSTVGIRWTTTNANLFNNTFYAAGETDTALVEVVGNSPGSALSSKNNIFYGLSGQSFFSIDSGSQMSSDHDLFYTAGGGTVLPSGSNLTRTNSVTGDPQFVSAAGGDLHLLSTSPAVDAGTNAVSSVVTRDYDGNALPIGVGYDIGALEYGSSTITTVTPAKVGAYSAGAWLLDQNGNFVWDGTSVDRLLFWSIGQAGEVPVYGDWNGDGRTKIGLYVNGTWLLDYNGNGVWDGAGTDKVFYFGGAGYTPVVGDWNGSGTTKIGVYQNGAWLLDYNGNFAWDGTSVDKLIYFGGTGYTPVVGDWNGSGTAKIGVHQNGAWLLDYNGNFTWDGTGTDKLVYYGPKGYKPDVGDWNGSGTTKVGAYQNGAWLLDYNGNFTWDGTSVDKLIFFGGTNYLPMTGDWNGSGTAKVGAYQNGAWLLDYNGNFVWDGTSTDKLVYFGGSGYTPVVGKW